MPLSYHKLSVDFESTNDEVSGWLAEADVGDVRAAARWLGWQGTLGLKNLEKSNLEATTKLASNLQLGGWPPS